MLVYQRVSFGRFNCSVDPPSRSHCTMILSWWILAWSLGKIPTHSMYIDVTPPKTSMTSWKIHHEWVDVFAIRCVGYTSPKPIKDDLQSVVFKPMGGGVLGCRRIKPLVVSCYGCLFLQPYWAVPIFDLGASLNMQMLLGDFTASIHWCFPDLCLSPAKPSPKKPKICFDFVNFFTLPP